MTGDTQSKANGSKPLKRERVEKSGIKESTKKRKMIVTIEEQPDPRERRR